MRRKIILVALCLTSYFIVLKSQEANRKDLASFQIASQQTNRIEVKEIKMEAGQKAPYHTHPCNVVGYIVSGTVLYEQGGKERTILKAGDIFYEPKDTPIHHFDNASESEPLIFIVYYLLEGDESLIKFPHKKN